MSVSASSGPFLSTQLVCACGFLWRRYTSPPVAPRLLCNRCAPVFGESSVIALLRSKRQVRTAFEVWFVRFLS